jgi:hypothetical protein
VWGAHSAEDAHGGGPQHQAVKANVKVAYARHRNSGAVRLLVTPGFQLVKSNFGCLLKTVRNRRRWTNRFQNQPQVLDLSDDRQTDRQTETD